MDSPLYENTSSFLRQNTTLEVQEWDLSTGLILTLMILLTLTILAGNILVIISIFTYTNLRNVQNAYIVSLCAADLGVGVLVMPFHISNFIAGQWQLGAIVCGVWLTMDILFCTASIFNLCVIALDRYKAVCTPLKYAEKRTLKRVLISIAVVWLLSTLISSPPLFGWNDFNDSRNSNSTGAVQCILTSEPIYVTYSACGSFFVPLTLMSFIYLKIYLATRSRFVFHRRNTNQKDFGSEKCGYHSPKLTQRTLTRVPVDTDSVDVKPSSKGGFSNDNQDDSDENRDYKEYLLCAKFTKYRTTPGTKQEKDAKKENTEIDLFLQRSKKISLRKERRVIRMLGAVMGFFIVCWLPFFLIYVVKAFCTNCPRITEEVEMFFMFLGYVNSAINPVLYNIFNVDFRNGLQRLLCKGR